MSAPTQRNVDPTIAEQNRPFLDKVMSNSGLVDPYDARDITEVIFRCMRDLMTTEAADRVANELRTEEALPEANDQSLQVDVENLWKDTNPLVRFLSRVRPPLHQEGTLAFTDDRFIFRVANESGMPRKVDPERVIRAVFVATKDELSDERIHEVAQWLPGKIRNMWEQA